MERRTRLAEAWLAPVRIIPPWPEQRLLVFDEPHIGGRLLHRLEGDAVALQLRDGQGTIDGRPPVTR